MAEQEVWIAITIQAVGSVSALVSIELAGQGTPRARKVAWYSVIFGHATILTTGIIFYGLQGYYLLNIGMILAGFRNLYRDRKRKKLKQQIENDTAPRHEKTEKIYPVHQRRRIEIPYWRQGRKVGRTIYKMLGEKPSDRDILIGIMDHEDDAYFVITAVNEEIDTINKALETQTR